MSNIFEGIANIITGFFQSIFAVIQSIFNVVYSLVHGVFTVVWDLLESTAQLVGASANFVFSNIVILGLLGVAFVVYRDRQSRARVGGSSVSGRKKVQ